MGLNMLLWVLLMCGLLLAFVEKAVYDGYRMVRVLMRKKMTEEEAREFISFAIEGKPMGPETPIIYWPKQTLTSVKDE